MATSPTHDQPDQPSEPDPMLVESLFQIGDAGRIDGLICLVRHRRVRDDDPALGHEVLYITPEATTHIRVVRMPQADEHAPVALEVAARELIGAEMMFLPPDGVDTDGPSMYDRTTRTTLPLFRGTRTPLRLIRQDGRYQLDIHHGWLPLSVLTALFAIYLDYVGGSTTNAKECPSYEPVRAAGGSDAVAVAAAIGSALATLDSWPVPMPFRRPVPLYLLDCLQAEIMAFGRRGNGSGQRGAGRPSTADRIIMLAHAIMMYVLVSPAAIKAMQPAADS